MGCESNCGQPQFPICLTTGATFLWPIYYALDDNDETPIDLTGYTAKFTIRESVDASDTILVATTDADGGITIDGSAGLITISIPPAITALLETIQDAVYDVFIYAPSPSTDTDPLIGGPCSISEAVTREDV